MVAHWQAYTHSLHLVSQTSLSCMSSQYSHRETFHLSQGIRKAVVNKSKKVDDSQFLSEGQSKRWRTTYSRESSTNRYVLGDVQLGSFTIIQIVGGCKNVAEGIVTGSN